jgi:hypothetical protein
MGTFSGHDIAYRTWQYTTDNLVNVSKDLATNVLATSLLVVQDP